MTVCKKNKVQTICSERLLYINRVKEKSSRTMGSLFGAEAFGTSPVNSTLLGRLLAGQSANVEDALVTTLSRIELDQTRVQRASQHYGAIKEWVESRLEVELRQVGSFQRSTKIRPTTGDSIDIDAVVCWGDATYICNSPGQGLTGPDALQQIHNVLIQHPTYGVKNLSIDSPVVTINYASEFSVELIPCFRNRVPPHNSFRNPASYLITNSIGGWEDADYDYDSEFITSANKNADGKVVPAIKLLKRFLRNNNIELKSFALEILVATLMVPTIVECRKAGVVCKWGDIICVFLNLAPNILTQPLTIPGSQSMPVIVPNAHEIARHMSKLGEYCMYLNKLPDSQSKFDSWRQFYGEPFPVV